MADYWQHGEKVTEHWLDLVAPDLDYEASVKWDGCVELYSASDHLHICDLADLIARLQALQTAARAHFGSDWPC